MINITKSSPGMIQHGFGPTSIETFPAAGDIPFGAAVMLNAQGQVEEATNGNLIGFAVVSHLSCGPQGYRKGDSVGVVTNGTVTVRGAGAIALNTRLNYHGTQKKVLTTGGNAPALVTLVAKTATTGDGLVDVFVATTK